MIHRDWKADVRQEYTRLHQQRPSVKSTKKLSLAKKLVRALAVANTSVLLAEVRCGNL